MKLKPPAVALVLLVAVPALAQTTPVSSTLCCPAVDGATCTVSMGGAGPAACADPSNDSSAVIQVAGVTGTGSATVHVVTAPPFHGICLQQYNTYGGGAPDICYAVELAGYGSPPAPNNPNNTIGSASMIKAGSAFVGRSVTNGIWRNVESCWTVPQGQILKDCLVLNSSGGVNNLGGYCCGPHGDAWVQYELSGAAWPQGAAALDGLPDAYQSPVLAPVCTVGATRCAQTGATQVLQTCIGSGYLWWPTPCGGGCGTVNGVATCLAFNPGPPLTIYGG